MPPHKKRGKGGRQPASDPRLDPNIDERRAKRILANRLSAARSKMKQKNQMDVSLTLYLIMQLLQILQFLVCREALFKVKTHCAQVVGSEAVEVEVCLSNHPLVEKEMVQVLSGMIKQLEAHKKDLTSDAAEMMDVCETLEFENRRMSRESQVRLLAFTKQILMIAEADLFC